MPTTTYSKETLKHDYPLQDIFDVVEDKIKENVSAHDRDIITRAYLFSMNAHLPQLRKSGEPYFAHVFEAGKNCAKFGMSAEVIAAGLMHDTVEDTEVTEEDMRNEFGEEIAFLVNGVTKLGTLKYRGRERHIESLRKFFVASAEDARVVIIKLADRLHNLQTLQHVREDKQKRIALESIEIHAALASRLGMGKLAEEIQDLAFPFAYPEEYEQTKKLLKHRQKSDYRYMEKVYRSLVKEMADKDFENIDISYRAKGMYSLYKKLKRKDMNLDSIHDIIALRVLVNNMEDCYKVLGLIHNMWRPLPGRIKDYIALPKPNGYQSLHTTIFTGDGGIAEIQIRTHEMHEIAEYGVASHQSYKFAKGKKKKAKETFDWLEQLKSFDKAEVSPDQYIKELKTDFFEDRIFVLTPKGDVIDLPAGATMIDFAYAVHTDIGSHLCSGKINGVQKSIKTPLNNRDIVEVAHKESCKPSRKWLDHAKTSMARKHISNTLKKDGSSFVKRIWGK